jgi:serpin B
VPDTPAPTAGFVRADVPRATTTDVGDEELAALVDGNTEFATDLYRALAGDENLVLSPYSIAAALTMTHAGARDTTAEEMSGVLHLGLDNDRIHTARNELDLRITAEPDALPDDDREPFTIRVANSLWGQEGYPFLEEFLTLLAEEYDAGMNLVAFANAAEEARLTINDWVEEQTEGRIVDLIPQGVIDSFTRLVLVNAIWFKANWASPFVEEATTDGPFTRLDGTEVTVPMMHGSLQTAYAAGEGYQAVRLPYAGNAAMVVVLPDASRFAELRDGFDSGRLDEVRDGLQTRQVDLAMPRFEFRSEAGLSRALAELGMPTAFNPPDGSSGADFTGITERRELFIQDVVHQAFIAVDEQGTEAAAATAVVIGLTSAPMDPVAFTIDRPFLFVIEHASTGEVLFLGQVTDPS